MLGWLLVECWMVQEGRSLRTNARRVSKSKLTHSSSLSSFLPQSGTATPDDNSILPIPNHVVLNHLTASAIRNGTLAVGTTTRYKRKVSLQRVVFPSPFFASLVADPFPSSPLCVIYYSQYISTLLYKPVEI